MDCLHKKERTAYFAPKRVWMHTLCLALGLALCTLLLCKESSPSTPGGDASQVQAGASLLAAVRDSAEKKGLEAMRVSTSSNEQNSWGFQNLRHRFGSSFSERGWSLSPMTRLPTSFNEPKREAPEWYWRYEFTSLSHHSCRPCRDSRDRTDQFGCKAGV